MLSDFHLKIWNYAEPALREYKSARAYVELLRAMGFNVDEGTGGGMPTAFLATFGEGKPILASFAEYDAVPANNQAAVPYKKLRDDSFHPYAAGHTDPPFCIRSHNFGSHSWYKSSNGGAWTNRHTQIFW